MRINTTERVLLLVAAAFVLFAIGYFTGRNTALEEVTVQTAAEVSVPVLEQERDTSQELPEQTKSSQPAGLTGSTQQTDACVNLNTATLDELQTLPGIGPVLAQRIVDYREANGAFRSVEEITLVSGIGEALLEKLYDFITVG